MPFSIQNVCVTQAYGNIHEVTTGHGSHIGFKVKNCFVLKAPAKKFNQYTVGISLAESPKLLEKLEALNEHCMVLVDASEDLINISNTSKIIFAKIEDEDAKKVKEQNAPFFI